METEWKRPETEWKQNGNNLEATGNDWKRSGSRAETDPDFVATITVEDIDYIRNQLSAIRERSQQNDFYDLDVNDNEAFLRYRQLKDHYNRKTIARMMFNIEGGRKWEQVRDIFDEWDRNV